MVASQGDIVPRLCRVLVGAQCRGCLGEIDIPDKI